LLALLLLLLLAAVGALVLIGWGDSRGPDETAVVSGPSRSTDSLTQEEAPASSPDGTLRPSHRAKPGAPAAAASATDTAAAPAAEGDGQTSEPGVDSGPGVPFTVAGNVRDVRVGVWTPIPTAITNPNDVPITITSLRVAVSGNPNGCDALANFETRAGTEPFTVPAGAQGYPVPLAKRPRIRLRSLSANQNRCKRQTITLSFSGSASAS
jgi:hypothetical protein